jgi:uncharacterized protein YcbX
VSAVRIGALAVFPVKSCAGLAPTSAEVAVTGLRAGAARDREWMVVDDAGRFVTQRECPELALVRVRPSASGIALDAPGRVSLDIARRDGPAREVVVWRDRVPAQDAGDDAARWLSDVVAREVRLVRFDPAGHRACDPAWVGGSNAHTMFADGYPVLVIGRGSLDALDARLAPRGIAPLSMARFRPNVVLEGLEPHDEDHVTTIAAGRAVLRLVKPCTRCTVPNVDPATGHVGQEPLATLAGYRMNERMGGVTFGMNAIVEREGTLAVGDAARVEYSFD